MSVTTIDLSKELREAVVKMVENEPSLADEFFAHLTGSVSTTRRRTRGTPVKTGVPRFERDGKQWYTTRQITELL